jgi:hypothetical protein
MDSSWIGSEPTSYVHACMRWPATQITPSVSIFFFLNRGYWEWMIRPPWRKVRNLEYTTIDIPTIQLNTLDQKQVYQLPRWHGPTHSLPLPSLALSLFATLLDGASWRSGSLGDSQLMIPWEPEQRERRWIGAAAQKWVSKWGVGLATHSLREQVQARLWSETAHACGVYWAAWKGSTAALKQGVSPPSPPSPTTEKGKNSQPLGFL